MEIFNLNGGLRFTAHGIFNDDLKLLRSAVLRKQSLFTFAFVIGCVCEACNEGNIKAYTLT